MTTPPGRKPRGPRRTAGTRKPDPARFAAFRVQGITGKRAGRGLVHWAVTAAVAAGIAVGMGWPQKVLVAEQESLFLMEEEIPPPPSPPEPPPPPPDPAPPPDPPKAEESPPPPQFGLQADDMSATGDLSVAAGNNIMKEAEPEVKPIPPPLQPAPVFVDQAPRILAGELPAYPERALDRGLEATVVALISIDSNGQVTSVSLEKSGGTDFDPGVFKAAWSLRFQAPTRGGRKVPARFRRAFEFRLEE